MAEMRSQSKPYFLISSWVSCTGTETTRKKNPAVFKKTTKQNHQTSFQFFLLIWRKDKDTFIVHGKKYLLMNGITRAEVIRN